MSLSLFDVFKVFGEIGFDIAEFGTDLRKGEFEFHRGNLTT